MTGVVYPPDLRHLSPSHLLDAVEKPIDGTDTTSGASESALAERQVAESGTARTHRATQRATRRSRTGDQVVADPADDDLAGVEADASRWLRGSSHRRWRLSVTQLPETSEVYPSD
jgi:microcystin degradation protein MlrC